MLKSSFSMQGPEAGLDEAGRGCLAGPVVAAAVILPLDYQNPLLRDSKKMSHSLRRKLESEIKEEALAWGIAEASPQEIDQINILKASHLAMQRAVESLKILPKLLLVDGNSYGQGSSIPYHCIVGGDDLYYSIAAASVLAKTYRDCLMEKLAQDYPGYGWEKNRGYPTREHKAAIARLGINSWHRQTFKSD